jgi:hypothetical protein
MGITRMAMSASSETLMAAATAGEAPKDSGGGAEHGQ